MIAWKEWRPEVFAEARRCGAPVLLLLATGRDTAQFEAAFAGLDSLVDRCVAVCADRCDRPDVHRRYREKAEVCLLNHEGGIVAGCALEEVRQALPRWLEAYAPPSAGGASAAAPAAWSGAVGGPSRGRLPESRPRETAAAILAAPAPLPPAAQELLLYAAAEWSDGAARARLETELAGLAARLDNGARTLGGYAVASRLLWDAFALTGDRRWREAALSLSSAMIRDLYDPARRAFRHAAVPSAELLAGENAQAALALQRAASFEPGFRFGQTADDVLAFLRGSAYDPLLGMIHRRQDGGTMVYGLLADNAWTLLAFSEAFLMSGHKPHREFADNLARFLFQELWDRDRGGFLDRVAQREDLGLLREPRPAAPEDHAAAFEGLWRLHHLKGNANYKRWLEWGLGATLNVAGAPAAGLARVQDMLARGRMDLELIGRPGEPATDALLSALHRGYVPRRIVSFVDPDDQDYILAHKLEAPSYPRLFGCGSDLRPLASAETPQAVPDVLKALS